MTYVPAPTLLQYAGDDKPARCLPAHTLWLMGYDTHDIAKRMNVGEHVVLRAVTKWRSRRRDLPDPYKVEV